MTESEDRHSPGFFERIRQTIGDDPEYQEYQQTLRDILSMAERQEQEEARARARAQAFLERLQRAGLMPDREEALSETIREQRWIIPTGNSAETTRFQLIDGNGRVARSTVVNLLHWEVSHEPYGRRVDLVLMLTQQMQVVGHNLVLDLGVPVTVIGEVTQIVCRANDITQVSLTIRVAHWEREQWSEPERLDAPLPLTGRVSGRITEIVPVTGIDLARDTPRNRHIAALAQGGRIYSGDTQPISPIPQTCRDCQFLCGEQHNGNLLVCAMHPYGNGEDCKDFEPR